MAMSQRGCLRQIRIVNLLARCSQLPNDVADGDGVPDQNGIGEQAQTAGLVHDFLVITGAKLTAIGEEQPASQFMPRFASIELQLHSPSNVLLVDIAKYEDRLDDPAQGAQRFIDSIRWRGAAQALKHYVCGRAFHVNQRKAPLSLATTHNPIAFGWP